MAAIGRRAFLRICLQSSASVLAAACTVDPARGPSFTVTPTDPAPASAAVDRFGAPTAKATQPTTTDAAELSPPEPAQDRAWAQEWQRLVAAAQREGRLSLLTWVGRGYRPVMEAFERTFPGIRVDRVEESSANVWLGRLREERRAGTYAFDLGFVQTDRALKDGAPDGMLAPLRPLLIHPDVADDRAWRDGFSTRFVDSGGDLCFAWSYGVFHAYAINTDLVSEEEITNVWSLLDPRWRGKVISGDPRIGSGLLFAASVARAWGSDILKPLLVDQQPIIVNDGPTGVAEPLARGRYPIAVGVRPKALDPLRQQGIGLRVRYLDLPDADFVPAGSLLRFDRAPNPAAAQLFANWILTQEGQALLAGSLETNSARTDVPQFQPDETARPGVAYFESDRETNYAHTAATQALIRGLLRGRASLRLLGEVGSGR